MDSAGLGDQHGRSMGAAVRTLQFIVGAMVICALVLLIVAMIVPVESASLADDEALMPILTYCAAGFAPLALCGSFVLPAVLTSLGRNQITKSERALESTGPKLGLVQDAQLHGLYATITILRSAMVEGAALLAGVAYLLERQPVAAGVAVVLIFVLAFRMPTSARLEQWIQTQRRVLEQTRALAT